MKIKENLFVSLAYELQVNGEIVDSANADKPLDFIYGLGMLLPAFEAQIEGKEAGETFEFTLTPEEGYGPYFDEEVVEIPKEIFMIDGVVAEQLLFVGNVLQMGTSTGQRKLGLIKEVKEESVIMDFNHQMAGKTLNFTGTVVGVRESNEEDSARFFGTGGGCGCGCGEGSCGDGCGDGGCEDGCCQ
ncbi:MAG: FKBP-type peptidyl-prolyl cis-trans isomerase [Rikenellaceae bacterium]